MILVLLENQKVLLLKCQSKDETQIKSQTSPTATEVNPNWSVFTMAGDIEELKTNVIKKSSPKTIEEVKDSKYYQAQITNWLIQSSKFTRDRDKRFGLEELLKKIHNKSITPKDLEWIDDPQMIGSKDGPTSILELKDSNQRHLVHHLAVKGFLKWTPKSLICSRGILEKDQQGMSPLEYHYLNYGFKDVPTSVWEISEIKNDVEKIGNILCWASRLGKFSTTPKELWREDILTKNLECGYTVLHQLAKDKSINCLEQKFLTHNLLLTTDRKGRTVYHTLAESGSLGLIIRGKISEEILDQKDMNNRRVAFEIALNGGLKRVGPEYWTIQRWQELEKVTMKCNLHPISKNGELGLIPKAYLKKEEMVRLDLEGQTAYHLAISSKVLHKVPKHLLDKTALLTPNSKGVSPLTMLVNSFLGWGKKTVPKTLEKDMRYALTFLGGPELNKISESGISKAEEFVKYELKRRVVQQICNEDKDLSL